MSVPVHEHSQLDKVPLATLLEAIQRMPNSREVTKAIETQITRINAQRDKISDQNRDQKEFAYNYQVDSYSVGC